MQRRIKVLFSAGQRWVQYGTVTNTCKPEVDSALIVDWPILEGMFLCKRKCPACGNSHAMDCHVMLWNIWGLSRLLRHVAHVTGGIKMHRALDYKTS